MKNEGTRVDISSKNRKAVFDLMYRYWVDQESFSNVEQEISYMDPRDLGFNDQSINAREITQEITNTDPALFEGDLAKDWQEFVSNRQAGME